MRNDGVTSVRGDRWLDVACVFKTRSQARQACQKSRISVNGRNCKPGHALRVGDELSIRMGGGWKRILRVEALAERNISRAEAKRLYQDLTPERPKTDPVEQIMEISRPRRLGRPTKRERRNLNRLRRQ